MATSIVETITPKKAKEYLDKSGGNRNISKAVVNSYATTMKQGKWLLNGEPIVFDINDVLLNGHHRLHAVILSDTPIQSFVTRGVEHEAYVTFDCGRHRTLGQLIGMQSVKHYNSTASAVQVVYRLVNNLSMSDSGSSKSAKKTNAELIDFFNRDRELFIEAGEVGANARNKAPFVEGSIVGGSYYYLVRYGHYDKEYVKAFFDDLCSLDTSKNPVVNLLRQRLLRDKTSMTRKTPRQISFALLVKTWNSYVTGDTVKCLKFNPETDEYPKFILK